MILLFVLLTAAAGCRSATQITVVVETVYAVGAGNDHTCAMKVDQTVWCWGSNGAGELGDGTNTTRLLPVQVGAVSCP